MKRILPLTLSCLLLFMLAGCRSSQKCSHYWKSATCEDPMTCEKCDETDGKANGHKWEKATCQNPKTCSVCSKTTGSTADHESGDWMRVEDADGEKEPGILVLPCAVCGEELDNFKGSALYNASGHRNSCAYYVEALSKICSIIREDVDGRTVTASTTSSNGIYNLNVHGYESVQISLFHADAYAADYQHFDKIVVSQYIFDSYSCPMGEQLENYYMLVAATMYSIDPFLDSQEEYIPYVQEMFTDVISNLGYNNDKQETVVLHGVKYAFEASYYEPGDSIVMAFGVMF